jgi:ABC-type lipoprotein export system ATPase subunit
MNVDNYPRGSEWRKWDLHIHSPNSYDYSGTWKEFYTQLQNANCDVIGINDYCCILGYEKVKEKIGKGELNLRNKRILPVVEFRMRDILRNRHIGQSGVNINFHIIFSDEIDIKAIETFIKSIKNKGQLIGNKYNDSKYLKEKVKVYFEKQIINELKDNIDFKDKFLIWLPYDEYGGIDEIDPQSDDLIKGEFIRKADVLGSSNKKQIDFFLWKSPLKCDGTPKFSIDSFENWFGKKKPCIKGSDSHTCDYPIGKLKDCKSKPTCKYCWIKADPTFEGLKQIIYEPDGRVFIGEEPAIFQRVRENKIKFIKSLEINQIDGYDENEGIWFKDIVMPINNEMVAIIGNKGSGKSAITDILSLCGNSYRYNDDDFSFLKQDRFLKDGLAKNFTAKLTWENNDTIEKNLNEGISKNAPERVQYLPQNYFERLTNDLEHYKFEVTLENIVFNHLPNKYKLGKKSFRELINYKEENVSEKIKNTSENIQKLNESIIELDRKKHPDHIQRLNSNLNLKTKEKKEHEKNKPDLVLDPAEDESLSTEQRNKSVELKTLQVESNILEEEIKKKTRDRENFNIIKEELEKIKKEAEQIQIQIDRYINKNKERYEKLNLSITDIIKYEINFNVIQTEINENDNNINELEDLLKEPNEINKLIDSEKKEELKKSSLILKKEDISEKIKNLTEELSEPQKKYQKYIEDLKKWNDTRQNIIGNEDDISSIKGLEKEIKFVIDELDKQLKNLIKKQIKKSINIYLFKKEIVDFYGNFKKSVDNEINKYRKILADYDINIDANLKIDQGFCNKFLSYINQNKKGTFYGVDEGKNVLKKIVENTNFNKKKDIEKFLNKIIEFLYFDQREDIKDKKRYICDQIDEKKLLEFYNYLFSLKYLNPTYELKLSNKKISLLSPGEKGALLIIFYLLLDKDNIPLIIDQPEENLDNESIFKILTHFIKKTKQKRQLIIVTHNPNLAIVGDAEQIIYVQIDKKKRNKFLFESGAIENPIINKHASDILEGTIKAFDIRRLKYFQRK